MDGVALPRPAPVALDRADGGGDVPQPEGDEHAALEGAHHRHGTVALPGPVVGHTMTKEKVPSPVPVRNMSLRQCDASVEYPALVTYQIHFWPVGF